MPFCCVCKLVFHPDWMMAENDLDRKCMWCELGKDTLTLEKEDGTNEKVNRKQAHRNYVRWMEELSKNEKVSEILVKPD